MEERHDLIHLSGGRERIMETLRNGNGLSARYGMTLSRADMQMLADKQAETLRVTDRVEFGRGPYEKLIYAFCDSPYLSQIDYAETLSEFCAIFYRFKNESGEQWSDDELIESMRWLYNGQCQGSLCLMEDRLWHTLHSNPDDRDIEIEGDTLEKE